MANQGERLREARKKAGYKSASAASEAFGWGAAAYRHHENGTREFDVETAKRYARAFRVNPGHLLALDKISTSEQPHDSGRIEVIGTVAAGVWREQTEWPPEDRYTVEVPPSPVRGAERYGLLMEGQSMDKTIAPGSTLECMAVISSGVSPQSGHLVIVERTKHELRETTCKRLFRHPTGEWELRCESTRPEFQEVIKIGKPDRDLVSDDEYRVIAIVIRAYQNHFALAR